MQLKASIVEYLISESQNNKTKFWLCFTAIVIKHKYIDDIKITIQYIYVYNITRRFTKFLNKVQKNDIFSNGAWEKIKRDLIIYIK
jgi:hypothetical protein